MIVKEKSVRLYLLSLDFHAQFFSWCQSSQPSLPTMRLKKEDGLEHLENEFCEIGLEAKCQNLNTITNQYCKIFSDSKIWLKARSWKFNILVCITRYLCSKFKKFFLERLKDDRVVLRAFRTRRKLVVQQSTGCR